MTKKLESVCVFCGASDDVPQHFIDNAAEFGKMLADQGIRLVYGGADCGIMGAIANSVMRHGGQVTGVFPKTLNDLENEHKGLSEIILVDNMHQRKWKMFERSDAFITFPGGFGTMDETFEIITWKQIRAHNKPMVIYNYRGYWDPWVELTSHIINYGFAADYTTDMYDIVTELEDILPACKDGLNSPPAGPHNEK